MAMIRGFFISENPWRKAFSAGDTWGLTGMQNKGVPHSPNAWVSLPCGLSEMRLTDAAHHGDHEADSHRSLLSCRWKLAKAWFRIDHRSQWWFQRAHLPTPSGLSPARNPLQLEKFTE